MTPLGDARFLQVRRRILITAVIIVIGGMIPTCATMSVFPGGTRLAAPIVCPSGTDTSVVVSRWGGNSKGGSSLKWDLYCMTPAGEGTIVSTPKIVLGLGLIYCGVLGVLMLALGMRRRFVKGQPRAA